MEIVGKIITITLTYGAPSQNFQAQTSCDLRHPSQVKDVANGVSISPWNSLCKFPGESSKLISAVAVLW